MATRVARAVCLLVGLGSLWTCEGPTPPDRFGAVALHIAVSSPGLSSLDWGRVRLIGPTNRDTLVTPGDVVTIRGLDPGTYKIVLEGYTNNDVAYYGETTGVSVLEGQDTPATVSFLPFQPASPTLSDTAVVGKQVTINFNSLASAGGYRVEWTTDSTFATGLHSASVTSSPAQLIVEDYGVYYIRLRGIDPYQSVGVPSPAARVRVLNGGPATQLVFTVGPSTTASDSILTPPVEVTGQDALGRTVDTFSGDVTVAIGANAGGGTLSGATTVTAIGGIATFPDLSIDRAGSGYTLAAATTGLPTATSTPFDIVPGAATQVVFTVQPSSATAGAGISPAIQVTAQDAQGQTDIGFTGEIVVAVFANPSGGTLSGTTTLAAVAGVVTFAGLSIDKAGAGYTLQATSGPLTPATSSPFNITAGPVSAAYSTVSAAPSTITASTGSEVSTISVTALDAYGNAVSGVTIMLGATGTGNTLTQPATPTNANGTALGALSSTVPEMKTVSATANGTTVTQTATVNVLPGADLVISTPATLTVTPTSVSPGGTVTLSNFTVANQGTITSNAFRIGYYLSANATITTYDLLLKSSGLIGILAPGGTVNIGGPTLTIPATTAPGVYFIGPLLDDQNGTQESNENNNFKSIGLTVSQ